MKRCIIIWDCVVLHCQRCSGCGSADDDQVLQLHATNLGLVCSTRSLQQREAELLQCTDLLQQEAARLQRTVAGQQQQVQEL